MGAASPLRVVAFRADATPAKGEPLIWVDPATEVLDPLWAKGVIIDGPDGRVVLCALDWCGIGGYVHRMFRDKLARAAKTSVDLSTAGSAAGTEARAASTATTAFTKRFAAAFRRPASDLASIRRVLSWLPGDSP
jgi:hypothetical protein